MRKTLEKMLSALPPLVSPGTTNNLGSCSHPSPNQCTSFCSLRPSATRVSHGLHTRWRQSRSYTLHPTPYTRSSTLCESAQQPSRFQPGMAWIGRMGAGIGKTGGHLAISIKGVAVLLLHQRHPVTCVRVFWSAYSRARADRHACTHVFARRYACAYLCLFLHTRQSTHTHKHKHTYAHTHTHAHAHARTTSRLLSLPPSVSFQTPSLPNTQATVRIFRLQEPGHGKRPVVLRSVSERITLGTQLQTPLQRQRSNLGIETYT